MEEEERALARRLGAALRRLRLERSLTQAEVAEIAGLSVNHLSYLECGERLPSLPMLLRLAQALRTSVGTLVGEKEGVVANEIVAMVQGLSPKARASVLNVVALVARGDQAEHPSEAPPREKGRVRHPKLPK